MYSYYKLYLSADGCYDKKIVRNTLEEIHKEIKEADPTKHNGYMVIEHIIELDQDNIVAMGKINPEIPIIEYKSHTRER